MRLNLEDHVDLVYRIDRVLQAYGYVVPAIVGMQALPPEHMTDLVVEVVPPDTTMGIGQVRSVRPRTEAVREEVTLYPKHREASSIPKPAR
ncbi:hypothetical protein LINPERPRIM_LOCUS16831 [Linum perenne]